MSKKDIASIPEISEEWFKKHIYLIRGQKVMLDSDLAEIYGYDTRGFNKQINNNSERFEGDEFMFQLTKDEFTNLKWKNYTSSWGGRRKLPYVFTEQGIYMLMTVLRGDLAIKQSKALIRLFKLMKDYLIETNQHNQFLEYSGSGILDSAHGRINKLEDRVIKIENKMLTKEDYKRLLLDFNDKVELKNMIIWKGNWFEASVAFNEIYSMAKHTIDIIDYYIDIKTLEGLVNPKTTIEITIYTNNIKQLPKTAFNDFVKEYNKKIRIIKIEKNEDHDRFIFIDRDYDKKTVYTIGTSLKDAGNSISLISMSSKENFI